MKRTIHAVGHACGGEYTACGLAFDNDMSENEDDNNPAFAKSGQIFTCDECRAVIDHFSRFNGGYRQP